jgi:molybdopterin molybdotransferase
MVSVYEAKTAVQQAVSPLPTVVKSIDEAIGYVLSADVYSQVDVPNFAQSSMDGYAFRFDSLISHPVLKIVGKIQAGVASPGDTLMPGEAVRIFTGAPVPADVDTVIIQEKTRVENGFLVLEDDQIKQGANVRPKGSEIKKGALGLIKGTILRPAGIGFLASIGVSEVKVYAKPSVSIIVTGDELQEPGKPLSYGQVYESNSLTVKSALQQMGIKDIRVYKVTDSLEKLISTLEKALSTSDMILLTGGISVGEYDFVSQATQATGIVQVFHKIKQKPGKPMYFGMKGSRVIFGLPGNPASVLTCFYQYVTLALDILSGTRLSLPVSKAKLESTYTKNKGITHFLKGIIQGETVRMADGQESYKLNSFARSNCLIEIPEAAETIIADTEVQVYLIQ